MRDTVEAFVARGGNAAFFSGNTSLWQVRIEGDDHDVMVGYKGFFKDDPLMGTGREAEVTTFWSDVIVARPENHMTGVSFTRGGYHRIGRNVTTGLGGYTVHRARPLDLRGHRARLRRRARRRRDGRRLRVRRLRVHLPRRAAVPDGRGRHAVDLRDPRHLPDAALHPRDRAPPAEARASRASWSTSPSRMFGTREPEAMERIRHGHAVLGAYTNAAGATVVTSGSTDWAHGLAGRDPQIEQITRNVLTRLGYAAQGCQRDYRVAGTGTDVGANGSGDFRARTASTYDASGRASA